MARRRRTGVEVRVCVAVAVVEGLWGEGGWGIGVGIVERLTSDFGM